MAQKKEAKSFLELYKEETHTYSYALVLILPLLLIYEAGILLVTEFTWRDIDVLANEMIVLIFQKMNIERAQMIPAFLVMITLFLLHAHSGKKWKINLSNTMLMHVEYAFYGLVFFFSVAWLFPGRIEFNVPEAIEVLLSIGAGVYEEFIFRLLLLSLLLYIMEKGLKVEKTRGQYAAVLVSALIFAGFHHILGNTHFTWGDFCVRTAAGIYFGIILLMRGYGVAAGTHVAFNLLKVLFTGGMIEG